MTDDDIDTSDVPPLTDDFFQRASVRMPIICFEGPSAVGKTTTANALEASYGAFVVPEVNQLFSRPQNPPTEWYFERQADRWSVALEQTKSQHLVILDGDPFQPLWYCWAYDFVGWHNLSFIEQFYRPRIQNEMIGFPDLYIIFSAGEGELRKRKISDSSRKRRGFEKHLKMIEPQRRYFEGMQTFSPNKVLFLKAETIDMNVEFIQKSVSNLIKDNRSESEMLLNKMTRWLREHNA